MGRKLQIVRKEKEQQAERVVSASEALKTDPFDEESGVPSTWGCMVENMVLQGRFNYKGEFQVKWLVK